jgi:hypothetical protein
MSTSKIRIKLGAIEVEYEGSESFLKEELPQLLSAVSDLYNKSHATQVPEDSASTSTTAPKNGKIEATTGSIAARLQVKSGSDLILAAVARITFALGTDVCSRQKIIDEMKTASSFYKKTHLGNLSQNLAALVRDAKLNEPSQDNYALTAATRRDLETKLA